MSARPPRPFNEPIRSYAPGSGERAALQARLGELAADQIEMPLVIGGRDVGNGRTVPAVMPHRTEHVLGTVEWANPPELEQAIAAAGAAWPDWSRLPWTERAAVFLRAADLLAGPWRDTLNAATMLGQSKTAH
ncbi:MAG TPA: aldehyde dehydrogenase family protein, partial [Candidatus Dormibacteraeota bacterium]